jgi:hypothetical protein
VPKDNNFILQYKEQMMIMKYKKQDMKEILHCNKKGKLFDTCSVEGAL